MTTRRTVRLSIDADVLRGNEETIREQGMPDFDADILRTGGRSRSGPAGMPLRREPR